jgi:hypothetical protein
MDSRDRYTVLSAGLGFLDAHLADGLFVDFIKV